MIAVVSLVVIWWVSEAINLCITALLPIVLLPILGITSASTLTLSYANEAMFLFMGGFMLDFNGLSSLPCTKNVFPSWCRFYSRADSRPWKKDHSRKTKDDSLWICYR
ncbi:MAG: hypothetical protein RSA02_00475 [Bacteroidales bacterium]